MPSLIIRFLLFVSSYFPLWVIFAVQFYLKGKVGWAGASLGFGMLGLCGLILYMKMSKKLNPLTIKVESVSKRDGEAMSYIVSYLLPFIAMPTANLGDIISLGIFIAVLCLLYINSDMIHINPILNMLGWHVYEVTLASGDVYALLCKRRIRKGRDVAVIPMAREIYLEVPK